MSTLHGISVIFDLDGTLVDSEPNYYEAGRQTLAEYGVLDFSWADHERYVGISTQETVTDWKDRYGLPASVDELLAAKNRRYLELARGATRAYPEMRSFVELLAAEGVPMAVASGSSPKAIAAVLTGTGLDAHLDTVVSADEVAHGKPAPDVFLEAARRLGADPSDCVVLEDAAPGGPPRTRPACGAWRSRTSRRRRTHRSSPPRGCSCRAARRSSRRGPRTTGS